MKYWPEFKLYKYGENPEVLIFQKVYWLPDYTFPEHFPGIKILDICDPDWLDNVYIKRTIDAMDAVTVPSKGLQEFLQQLTDKPVRIIKDRFDMEFVPKLRKHKDEPLKAVWFGYAHNAEVLQRGAIKILEQKGIELTIISDDDPLAWRWAENEDYKKKYKFYKYSEETIYERLSESNICILPEGYRPKDKYKSNNKTIKAYLASLPVVKDIDDLEKYSSVDARNKSAEYNYTKAVKEYDVKLSVKEMKELIDEISSRNKKN